MKPDIYQAVTDTIVEAIEQDPGRVVMPWHRSSNRMPDNPTTGNRYSGVNVLQLWASAAINGYDSSQWASYKQWQATGAQVKKGAKSTMVVFFKELPREEDEEKRVVLRYSRVFNASQVEGYEPPPVPDHGPVERLQAAETAISDTGIPIKEQGDRACYVPSRDEVYIPNDWRFFDTPTSSRQEAFYSVIFHELTHATGHKKRLDRELGNRFGSEAYALEELIAELGAAFCCARLGISNEPRQDHAQYLKNWLQALQDDSRAIFRAAAHAQRACDYLLQPP